MNHTTHNDNTLTHSLAAVNIKREKIIVPKRESESVCVCVCVCVHSALLCSSAVELCAFQCILYLSIRPIHSVASLLSASCSVMMTRNTLLISTLVAALLLATALARSTYHTQSPHERITALASNPLRYVFTPPAPVQGHTVGTHAFNRLSLWAQCTHTLCSLCMLLFELCVIFLVCGKGALWDIGKLDMYLTRHCEKKMFSCKCGVIVVYLEGGVAVVVWGGERVKGSPASMLDVDWFCRNTEVSGGHLEMLQVLSRRHHHHTHEKKPVTKPEKVEEEEEEEEQEEEEAANKNSAPADGYVVPDFSIPGKHTEEEMGTTPSRSGSSSSSSVQPPLHTATQDKDSYQNQPSGFAYASCTTLNESECTAVCPMGSASPQAKLFFGHPKCGNEPHKTGFTWEGADCTGEAHCDDKKCSFRFSPYSCGGNPCDFPDVVSEGALVIRCKALAQ